MMTRHALRFSVIAAGLILVATLTTLVWGMINSEEVNAQGNCTLKTIKGTYIFEGQGTFIVEGTGVPYTEAGIWTLDGEGNTAGVFSYNFGTDIVLDEEFTSTYTHDGGCIFATVAPVGEEEVTFKFYTTPSGQTMTYFGPGFSGTHRRQ